MYRKALKAAGRLISLLMVLVVLMVVFAIGYDVVHKANLESQAEIGMDKSEVLSNLEGENYRLSDTLWMCENDVWYGDCESASNSNSVEFLILKIGFDTWLVVGFNNAGKASFVGRGDT